MENTNYKQILPSLWKMQVDKNALHLFNFAAKLREAVVQRCSWEKVFWKYLQENTHAEVRFQ